MCGDYDVHVRRDVMKLVLTFYVLDSKLLNEFERENTACKCTTEDIAKFSIETTNAHILELEIWR